MSGITSVIAGDIWAKAAIFGPGAATQAGFYAENGVTDVALQAAYEAANQPGYFDPHDTSVQAFLDGLSPSQLQETAIGHYSSAGTVVTTYGNLKAYVDAENGLADVCRVLCQTASDLGGHLTASNANASDVALIAVGNLADNLVDNKPGALAAAQAFLNGLRLGQPQAIASADRVFHAYNAETAYRANNPQGNWAASEAYDASTDHSDSAVALTLLAGSGASGESQSGAAQASNKP